ncbi:hypothetical protein CPB86DRAFT_797632 [Serendipita vermifera]|nr:hypothetical protein CPB86DRAFT_797632 [Serendipita vermifera]
MAQARVVGWLQEKYPKPKVDPDWLEACIEFLLNELQLDQGSQWNELAKQVELQLLQSDLSDSMQRQTGFPTSIHNMKNGVIGTRTSGGGILVQINAITEIGASAFTLRNVRQARMDKADMTGLTREKIATETGEDQINSTGRETEDEDVTMPSYPRSMLSLMLSDGSIQIKAMEYKRLDVLKLGETPLGCKLFLQGVRIRNGIALLEPATVQILGYQNDDLQASAELDFVRSLRRRMGKPEEDPEEDAQLISHQEQQLQSQIQQQSQEDVSNANHHRESISSNESYSVPAVVPNAQGRSRRSSNSDGFDLYDDASEMDEEFWKEIDAAEKKATSQVAAPRPTTGRMVQEIIEIDDSDEDEEIVQRVHKRTGKAPAMDTIILSD